MAAAGAYDAYLLEGRQAGTWEVPDVTPIGWHCGRSIGPRHCVTVTPTEDKIWTDFVRAMIFYSFPVVLLNLAIFRRLEITDPDD
jgi:hypothetical protein